MHRKQQLTLTGSYIRVQELNTTLSKQHIAAKVQVTCGLIFPRALTDCSQWRNNSFNVPDVKQALTAYLTRWLERPYLETSAGIEQTSAWHHCNANNGQLLYTATSADILSLETWILIGTVLLLIRYYLNKKWQYLSKYNIPHHKPSIMKFGTFKDTFGDKPNEFFTKDLELKAKFGMVFGSYMGTSPRITISDPDMLKQIMIKDFNNFCDRTKSFLKLSGEALNNSLTNITGDTWRRVRHTMSPLFSTAKLRGMVGVTEKCADVMIANLRTTAAENGGKFDVKGEFSKYTLDALCSAAFGVKVETQTKEDSKPIKMAKKLFARGFNANILVMLMFVFPPLEKLLESIKYSFFPKDAMDYFSQLTEAILKNRENNTTQQTNNLLYIMADSLITDKEAKFKEKGMTKLEITGNGVMLLLAGYETTSNALNFLMYNLAWNKEAQQKLREETQELFQKDKPLDYDKLNEMKFLTQCLNESLRLYPPAVRNVRHCEEEITINGLTIPKGIDIDIPAYGLSRDPEYWDEPLEFKPERMEDMSKIDPIIFQPFGAGPRNCIGMRLALLQIKLTVCKLLLNFEFDVTPETPKAPMEIVSEASVRPKVDILYLKAIPLDS